MASPLHLGYAANVGLAVFLAFTAILVETRLRIAGRHALATYLILVCLNYALDALAFLLEPLGMRGVLTQAAYIAALLDPPFMLLFALAFEGARARAWLATLLLSPSILLAGTATLSWIMRGGVPVIGLRPPYAIMLATYYLVALVILARAFQAARTPRERDLRAGVVVGFALIVLPRIALLTTDLGLLRAAGRTQVGSLLKLEAILWPLALVGSAIFLASSHPDARPAARRAIRATLLLICAVEAAWLLRFIPDVSAASFALLYSARWFVLAGIVAVGLGRREVLGMPASVGRRVRIGCSILMLFLSVVEIAAVLAAWTTLSTTQVFGTALILTAFAAGAVALLRERGDPAREEWRLRRARVYRAHLELGAPADELERLRAELGLSESEAHEESRLVALERAAPAAGLGRPAVGQTFAGRYHVARVAGGGTFGLVYHAHDRIADAPVVLKELRAGWRADARAVERFRREAELALRVSNPHLVALLALERATDGHVLVMRQEEGETLRARLARGALDASEARALANDLLDALAALHSAGIVHRDVKPENILLRADGSAVLLDLGAAVDHDGSGTHTAGNGSHPGTPAYASPEQRMGARVGPTSDLYAAGVVLWEALTSDRPPTGTPPSAWQPLLARALAPDPAARFPTALAMRAAIPTDGS